jgi:hypothetical protein
VKGLSYLLLIRLGRSGQIKLDESLLCPVPDLRRRSTERQAQDAEAVFAEKVPSDCQVDSLLAP